ncbi:HD domain-containing protein [Roseomonas sp. SSH11]|uniref:HD domain-containing protein n=1 Tax=Pararoseomonas baculiformis TaxID=2820812 RepID=A0ABS4AFJ8_9PROT|nr:HD domain-containing protein [Pararoseomonas baculiformis]MBP0445799.1 HD domain-containing protein [Pararoseomonas baculiformis]
MNFMDRRPRREITDALRATVLEDLPELADVKHEELRRKCVEVWCLALAESSFARVSDIPGESNPGQFALKRGDQATHLRGVTRIALSIADEFAAMDPAVRIDRDLVIAGGLTHDVGKPWEFDEANRARWTGDPSATGLPSLRHPVYGAHLCIAAGLPEELAHIALAHSFEGEHLIRSLECLIVQRADHLWWSIAGGCGLLQPLADPILEARKIVARPIPD